MWRRREETRIITSWTNGRKALVHLIENSVGEKRIMKIYRPGFERVMFREYLAARYVSKRVSVAPRVLSFRPMRRELVYSYIRGQRVLEWVLERLGDTGIELSEFQSFHGLDSNPRVADAFARFRESKCEETERLKQAIRVSYAAIHQIGFLHGSCDPRNIIYDGEKIFLIDFDHARPSLNPAKVDYRSLSRWYGLQQEKS
jgi:predicted Ser/Thr protein kinase